MILVEKQQGVKFLENPGAFPLNRIKRALIAVVPQAIKPTLFATSCHLWPTAANQAGYHNYHSYQTYHSNHIYHGDHGTRPNHTYHAQEQDL